MGQPLRVLMVEDDERDAELLVRELRRCGYDVIHERVDSASTMRDALQRQAWDLVVSDYAMPSFDAPHALEVFRERGLDCPFIIVSGTVDEETAVDAMRAGAHDFMAKGKLVRLGPVIARALREAAGRAERRHMQEQLLVSDRMASLGTLAAGVAHEINNPLAAVVANVDIAIHVLRSALGSDTGTTAGVPPAVANLLDTLGDALDAALRVRDVTRDLKVFSRGDEIRRGPVDVRRVLESALRLAHNEVRHRAQLVRAYADVPAVYANETRLGQVFLNLIVNAAQSLPEGQADRHTIRIVTRLEAPDQVRVEIQDDGPGIPQAVLPRIFDPFFTTKPLGVGTGLGLAISHRIVTALGGEITVETQQGHGTSFRVSLPVAVDVHSEPEPAVVMGRRTRTRGGKILVIDDDAMVGAALTRVFQTEYDVTFCVSATDAVGRIDRGERFDLIFCDLHMPQLTGMEVFERLGRTAPDQAQRMVFMTGGVFTPAAREFLEHVPQPRIDKPFDVSALRAFVGELLE